MSSNSAFTEQMFSGMFEVRPSTIHGLGLFARKHLPKGTIWLAGTAEQKLVITRPQYEILTQSEQTPDISVFITIIHQYAIYDATLDVLILFLNDSRYVNHATNPNSYTPPGAYHCEALRDIEPGEEILEDYNTYDHCPWAGLTSDPSRW